ncbi:GTP-binding protein Rhes [Dunckerocampus dactyliophorus]|uniref:GTP-binding protein Rhes n=1 Tax=Dunckerocampus dactyliophorus TaxID=161453 RepID=UPI002406425B|nr:GTP-binding protein Rhes [Dunckerocampus dactyliophorus]
MNTTEKFHLPVDGVLKMFNTFTRHHRSQSPTPTPVLQQQHPKVLSKTSMGLLETVKGRWRQQDNRAVESVSSDPLPHRCADVTRSMGVIKPRNCHRIVVLGAPQVGKTSVVRRFLGEDFQEQHEPTAEDFHRKLFHIGGETYQVDLLDASMERNFPAKRRLSILTGDIFLLVFSLCDRESFSEVCELLSEIKAAKTKLLKVKQPARLPVVVCGNKVDLAAQRAVSRSEVTEALTRDVTFVETSAKCGTGLEVAFKELAVMGGLPDETSPSRHQLVSMVAYQSLCVNQRGRRRSRTPCAVVDSLVRRPSFGSDLQLVLGSSTKANKPERCHIQ